MHKIGLNWDYLGLYRTPNLFKIAPKFFIV